VRVNEPSTLETTLASVAAPEAVTAPATGPSTLPASSFALATEEATLMAPTYPMPRLELVEGRGARVRAVDGTEYLDFVSGIAVNAFGHAPPGLARAVAKQMRGLGHVSNLFTHRPGIELARELLEATGYARAFFCNSGAEGVEAALKFARVNARSRERAGREWVAFRGGFHGRTGLALSVTWTPSYREPFEPLVPGVRFGDFNDVAALVALIDERACGVVVEPVQGEGGAVPATQAFLSAVRARCDATGALLILDEVQSGMGRCGRLLAAEHYGVRGDITVLSKALGGGVPIAAVLMSEAVASSLAPGMHGCTFGGNPVSAAAARWMLERVRKPRLLAKVRRRGRELGAALAALVARHPQHLKLERGLGLLRAIELAEGAAFDAPALVAAARAEGLLLIRGGERAVRLLPPLDVTTDEIHEAGARLERAVQALALRAKEESAT
jgi:predicted acetylornithine/succinylornithine family transaminase